MAIEWLEIQANKAPFKIESVVKGKFLRWHGTCFVYI